jgi:hypothetical protein
MDTRAPIALFVYNRPVHTSRTLEALRKNENASATDIYIFADGPKPGASHSDIAAIREVRNLVSSIHGFRNVILTVSETNLGLAASVVKGINTVLENAEAVIVLEDDVLTSVGFLTFCNSALNKYAEETDVAAISGYLFPIKSGMSKAFFMSLICCWGWATWKRAWKLYEPDPEKLIKQLEEKNHQRKFDLNNSYPYFNLLKLQLNKKVDSWAIRWYASLFLRKKLMLYPPVSLTQNIGMDGSGRHFRTSQNRFHSRQWQADHTMVELPENIIANVEAEEKIGRYLYESGVVGRKAKAISWIRNVFKVSRQAP